MSVKNSVFASRSEHINFEKLSRQWGSKYRIYHNLPFLNVFDIKNLVDPYAALDALVAAAIGQQPSSRNVEIQIEYRDEQRLKKTSIDYTLCDENQRPLVCIDFDGMQQGVNIGTEYVPIQGFSEWRQTIMELKLKVAFSSLFPYFIVGSSQFGNLSPDIELTIVDGIIGDVFAGNATRAKLHSGFAPTEMGLTQEEFQALSYEEQHEVIQDWVIGVEVENELENNPVSRKRMELQQAIGSPGWREEFVYTEDVEFSLGRATSMNERRAIIEGARWLGHRTTITTPDLGDVSAVAWLPNFKAIGFSCYSLLPELSFIFAADKVSRRRSN